MVAASTIIKIVTVVTAGSRSLAAAAHRGVRRQSGSRACEG
jgi:hypothetical protein